MNNNYYIVLFTGGIDSSYRLCQLALDETAVIHPLYIIFPNRPELKREIIAQNEILEYLSKHPNTKATILPIKRINRDEIPKDKRILDLESLLAKYNFGWQYLYIALLAKWIPNIELCHETLPSIMLNGKINFKIINGHKVIDVKNTDELFAVMFENVIWPILGTTRHQMIKKLRFWGYDDILQKIWFCYNSVSGKPCGICDNCRAKIKEELYFLFPAVALHRYLIFMFLQKYHPQHSLDTYYEYVYFGENSILNRINSPNFNNDEADRIKLRLKFIKKLDKLSDNKLKYIIKNGSLDYGYSKTAYNLIMEKRSK